MITSFTPNDPPHIQRLHEDALLIRDAVLAHDMQTVTTLLQNDIEDTLAHLALKMAAIENVLPVVELLAPKLDVKLVSNYLIQSAGRGLVEVTAALLPFADVTHNRCAALLSAAANGHQKVFEMLCDQWTAPYTHIEHVATSAAGQGHLGILNHCMKLASFDLSLSLNAASRNGKLNCVKRLRDLCDQEARIGAIFGADQGNHHEVVDLLWNDARAHSNWTSLAPPGYKFNLRRSHLARLKKADEENRLLHEHVDAIANPKSSMRKL